MAKPGRAKPSKRKPATRRPDKRKLSKAQIERALDQLREWFPEEAANIDGNRELLVDHILSDRLPEETSPLRSVRSAGALPRDLALPVLTPCEEACGWVAVDVTFFIIGLVGLRVANQERASRAIIREIGPATLRGFARPIYNFGNAVGGINRAKALFPLAGGIWNAGGKAVLATIREETSWWQWVKVCVIAIAQITAWFATDGVAFVALVALSVMSAVQLVEDSIKAVNVCGPA